MATQLASLSQVREYIGNSADGSDDALLTRLAVVASELIERACSRTLGSATYIETRNGNGMQYLSLTQRPITAVASVSINGVDVQESTAWNVPGWAVESPWRLVLVGGLEFTRGVRNVRVQYTAGYTAQTMPPDLIQAACLMTSLLYKERDRLGINSKTVGGESISFTSDEFPPSVAETIRVHRTVALPT